MENQIELKLKINYLRDMWLEFCEKHTELYELTCDEYMHLLSSEIEKLEETVETKNNLVNYIGQLEQNRNELTTEISILYNIEKPKKLNDLVLTLEANQEIGIATEIKKLNLVLLDIIEKIQEQNKKNQVFLNKAIFSLRELKDSFTGKTTYNTYSSSGMSKNSNTY
ncbi:MAG: flagellar biosynthesis/type III secretory pathway chaperone [Bacteriovoracaceae bacterium]|jgi:flagellar biosynthesis/type III secretory pathway chaperone